MTYPKIDACLARITPMVPSLMGQAMNHIDSLTKPQGSLGRLEDLAARLYAVQQGATPIQIDPARIFTVAADHGVAEEGVSVSPVIVTRQQVHNFCEGGGAISVLATANGIDYRVVDAGVAGEDFPEHPKLIRNKIASGTANMTKGPAMTEKECAEALSLGITLAEDSHAEGYRCLGTGEMGIGNTTASTALFCALYGIDPGQLTGPGAGLPEEKIPHKAAVIAKALEVNAEAVQSRLPFKILAALGGLEIATLTGLILGSASLRMPIAIDGYISAAAYAVAMAIAPAAGGYCFFSHMSAEPGHASVLRSLGKTPLLDLRFRLGEGTGAVFGMVLMRSAAAMFNNMATFDSAKVTRP